MFIRPEVVDRESCGGDHTEHNIRYQEDATACVSLELAVEEIQSHLKDRLRTDWDPKAAGSSAMARQMGYFGIFDG